MRYLLCASLYFCSGHVVIICAVLGLKCSQIQVSCVCVSVMGYVFSKVFVCCCESFLVV